MHKAMCNTKSIPVFDEGLNWSDEYNAFLDSDTKTEIKRFVAKNIERLDTELQAGTIAQVFVTHDTIKPDITLQIITPITISPVHHFYTMYSAARSGRASVSHMGLTNKHSTSIGMPLKIGIPGNLAATAHKKAVQGLIRTAETAKATCNTIITKHLSKHDIAHMATTLSEKNLFPISKWATLTKRIHFENNKSDGMQSLFNVISAIYYIVLSNTNYTRGMYKLSNLHAGVADYLRNCNNQQPRIMCKEIPLNINFLD